MKFRPEAEIWPVMSDADLKALAEDIDEQGLKEPINLLGGDILDGRNRWLAITRFGKNGKLPPLDHRDKTLKDQTLDDGISKATIYEAWDKERKVALWFHKDIPDALDMRDDPLELDGFFP